MQRRSRPRQLVPLLSRSAKRAPPVTPLRFSPWAWAKLLYLRDAGPTEIGGFGIATASQPLLVTDVQLVRQRCTAVTVEFDDQAVADYYDRQVDAGRQPAEFARIWIHTHPGHSPLPSSTDEATFERCFGQAAWSVMFILAAGGSTYARLRLGPSPGAPAPGGQLELPVHIDFAVPFAAPQRDDWQQEYADCVELSPDMFRSLECLTSAPSRGPHVVTAADRRPAAKAPGRQLPAGESPAFGSFDWEPAYE